MFSVRSIGMLRRVTYFTIVKRAIPFVKIDSYNVDKYKCVQFNSFVNVCHKREIHVSAKYLRDDARKVDKGKVTAMYIQNPFRWLNVRYELFMLRTQWDPEFSYQEFIQGTRQAVCTVINLILERRHDDLRGLVPKRATDKVVNDFYNQISSKRIEISKVQPEDIYVAFPYEVNFHTISEKRYCDIDMIFLCVVIAEPPDNLQMLEIGARFHREYTEGSIPDWMVTKLEIRKHGRS